jgi:SAM-dependent methyltransferase
MSSLIPVANVEWLRDRQMDPNGRVFVFEGEIYRAIYPSKTAHVRGLFERGIVEELVAKGLLIATELTDLQMDGYPLVLKHRKLPYRTKPYEWPRGLLRDGALCVLDLNLALLKQGLMTVDAHAGNLNQANGCRPVWTDFGSIVPLRAPYPAEQFRRYFTNPLQLLERAPTGSQLARAIIRDGGLDSVTLNALQHPKWSPLRAVRPLRERIEQKLSSADRKTIDPAVRERELLQERERVEAIQLDVPETPWGAYHHNVLEVFPSDYAPLRQDSRRAAIFRLIDQIEPRRVIDLAANAGFYSFYAARSGAEVLGLDFDESAVERFYRVARTHAEDLSVTCACVDAMESAPVPRKAELALALALTHHLLLGQGYTFEAVASMLARATTSALVVEFMPNGLGGTVPYPDPLPGWYTLDNFIASLRPHFGRVEIVDYPVDPSRNRRVLILADQRLSA